MQVNVNNVISILIVIHLNVTRGMLCVTRNVPNIFYMQLFITSSFVLLPAIIKLVQLKYKNVTQLYQKVQVACSKSV